MKEKNAGNHLNEDDKGIHEIVFYVYRIKTELGEMISIYDLEVIDDELIKGLRHNDICRLKDINKLVKRAVSITFYGHIAVQTGIQLGYIHPAAVKKLNDVPVAMFIKTY